MIQRKSSKVLRRVVVILLIAIFTIAGIIACSGDAITGSGGRRGYTSETDGGGLPENPDNPGDTNTSGGNTGGDTNTTGGNTNVGGDIPPSLPNDNPGDYYDLRVPFVVKTGFTNVSYKDTNKIRQLWFDQINRKGMNDGKVFAIRNRSNDKDPNNFQNRITHGRFSAQDYYYFNENGDIVYKEDNTIIKKFMGATIVRYRDLDIKRGSKKGFNGNNTGAIISISWSERKHNGKPLNTIGGIYANALTLAEAKAKYHWDSTGNDPHKDGVYDFIASRWSVEHYHDGFTWDNRLFERQYTNTGFIEILVMYDFSNDGFAGASAIHSYYAYHGSGNTTKGFTPQNMPYMTNHNLYLGERPEFTMNRLNCSTLFTDGNWRYWSYMFMPGKPDITGRSVSINPIPTW